jgi:fused signal recognition particle receptor
LRRRRRDENAEPDAAGATDGPDDEVVEDVPEEDEGALDPAAPPVRRMGLLRRRRRDEADANAEYDEYDESAGEPTAEEWGDVEFEAAAIAPQATGRGANEPIRSADREPPDAVHADAAAPLIDARPIDAGPVDAGPVDAGPIVAEQSETAPGDLGSTVEAVPSDEDLETNGRRRGGRRRRRRQDGDEPGDEGAADAADSERDDDLDDVDEDEADTETEQRQVRIRGRLRRALKAPFTSIRGRGRVTDAVLGELEEALLLADVGLGTTTQLITTLREQSRGKDADILIDSLRELAIEMFAGDDIELHFADEGTTVWLLVGVNGVGKTTTIGKLARREADLGRQVVLAAGDTFRAAAGEQLALWATRTGTDIVEGADGADPSSVVYDAIAHAAANGADLVLADTAGRLHTKTNLMVELQKIRRVADRPPGKVTEVLLVLDATTGQNGLVQARQFTEAVGVTGIVLTKLDGTARGGIVLAIRTELGLPIKLVGLGEGEHDLVPFDAKDFAEELIG